jgi:hypothetical protein
MAEKNVNYKVNVDTGDAQDDLKDLKDGFKDTGKAAEKSGDKIEESSKKGSKGIKGIGTASKIAGKGIKAIGTAMKAAGIGLVVAAVAGLFAIMSQNQKVVDFMSSAMNTLQLGVNAVGNAISKAYNKVVEATDGFDALKKTISGLLTVAITPLKLAFFKVKEAIQAANLAYQTIFGDDASVKKAQEALLATTKDIFGVVEAAKSAGSDIYNNIGEAFTEVGQAVTAVVQEVGKIDPKKIIEAGQAMTELKNNAELAAATQAGLVEKYDRQAEQLRQIRDEERNSISDRKKANDELLETLDEMETAMLAQANAQVASAQANVDANNSIENQVALIDALSNKQGVLAQVEGLRSEQKANDLALDKEAIELNKAKEESEDRLSIERKRFNAEQIEDETLRLEALQEIYAQEAEIEAARLQALIDNANNGTQAKVDAQIALDEFMEESRQKQIEGGNAVQESEEKNTDARKAMQSALVNQIGGAVNALGALFKEGTEASKIATLADIALGTATGFIQGLDIAQKGAKATGPAAPFAFPIFYATQVAAVLGAVGKAKTAMGGKGGGVKTPTAPTIQQVSYSPEKSVNQLIAESNQGIANNGAKPMRAYVVSGDVSTSQQLERNAVDGASI